jgi:hypothetical protein
VEENLYRASLGTVLVLLVLLLWRPRWAKGKLTAPVALAVALTAVAAALPHARRHWPRPAEELPTAKAPVSPLAAGQPLPALEAGGWLGGPPPVPGAGAPRVIVLDVCALW